MADVLQKNDRANTESGMKGVHNVSVKECGSIYNDTVNTYKYKELDCLPTATIFENYG